MTRIVAGFAGSVTLAVPRAGTRPTSDRVREALFSSLESMDAVRGMNVLDLYAGSGALALEAVSRGAVSAVLIEQSGQAVAVCKANAAALLKASAVSGLARPRIQVRQSSVRGYLARGLDGGPSIDLALIDPPYDVDETELAGVLGALCALLSDDAVVVVERSTRSPEPDWPAALESVRSKTYGETAVWFAQPAAPSQPE